MNFGKAIAMADKKGGVGNTTSKRRFVGTVGKLSEVEKQLIRDLKDAAISLQQLAEKYGVSRQAIYNFIHRRGITRPKKQKKQGHAENECSICRGLLRIAKKQRSEFICYYTLREQLGLQGKQLSSHLSYLRRKKLVSPKFGRLLSKRAELAYSIYFRGRLPIRIIGRQVGIRNFHSTIHNHRASGWDVPAPLFKFDGNEIRSRLIKRRKK